MFIRLIGIILIVISSTLTGFQYGNRYLHRIEDLKSLKKSLIILNGELKFNKTLLGHAVKKMTSYKDMKISGFYETVLKYIDDDETKNFKLAWDKAVEDIDNSKKYCFNSNDIKGIIQFGNQMVNTDAESQVSAFEEYINELENEISESVQNKDNKVKVYRTIGIMTGMFIAILII